MNLSEQFVEFLNSQKKKPSKATVKNYKADVLQFTHWFEKQFKKNFDPAEITSQTIELYKSSTPAETEHQLSPRSLKRHLSSLRKFFHFLKLDGIVPNSPFDDIGQPTTNNQQPDPWHIRDFKNYLYVYNASTLTIKNYVMDIKQFMQWAQQVTNIGKEWQTSQKNIFDKIDWKLIEEYKLRLLNEHFSPLTINRKLSSLRKYIAWAKEQGYIKKEAASLSPAGPLHSEENRTGILSSMPNITPQVKYAPVPPADLRPDEEHSTAPHLPTGEETPSSYSAIPPLRLGQKIIMAGDSIFDSIFIEPLALAVKGAQYATWKMRGKPVFKASKTQVNTPKQVYNVKKGFYAEVSTKNMALPQKAMHHLRFTRPKWYIKYHSYPFVHYLHFGALVILMCILGFYVFQNIRTDSPGQFTQIVASDSTKRALLFQGKLADSKNTPITSTSSVKFTIYDGENKEANSLWTETLDVNPKDDGSFSIILGNKSPLYQNLFVKNYTLWLGIAIERDPELVPRQQLANVALSENSQALDGMLPITQSKATNKNVVLALDSSGNLTIGGEASSTFQAIGGELVLSGNVLTLTTVAGTNSDIALSPDGFGKVDIRKQIYNSSEGSTTPGAAGTVEIADNLFILASSSAQSGLTINQTDVGPIISASSSGIAKFTVDGLGNTTIAGDLILAGSRISASTLTDVNFGNSSFTVGAINTTGNFSQTGSTSFSTGTGSARFNGNVFIGTSSANTITFNGRVAKDTNLTPISPTGVNDLGAASFPWDTLYANYVKPGGTDGQQGWWSRSGTTLSPANSGDNASIGGTLGVTGTTTLSSTLGVTGATTLSSTLGVSGATTLSSTLGVTGATTLSSTLGVTGATTLSSTLAVTGNTTLTGDLAVNGGDITTTATTFNLANATATTLNIGGGATAVSLGASTGTTTVNNALTATGLITANGGLTVPSGQTTTLASFTSNGGILYTNASGVVAQVTAGTSNQVLHGGTTPSFSAVSLTADVSGVLPIANGGTNKALTLAAGAIAYTDADSFELTGVGNSGQCLLSGGTGTPTWGSCTSGTNWWDSSNGALYPVNSTLDFLVGGQATTSAKFAVLNVNSGTPTASVSAGLAGGAYLTATGNLATTAMQNMTLGGSTTGNITIDSGTGEITLSDATIVSSNLTVAGTTGLTLSGTGGQITFANGETVDNDTDGTVLITSPTTQTSGNLTVAGTGGLTLSGVGGDITFANGEKIDNDTDGTVAITAPTVALSTTTALTASSLATFTTSSSLTLSGATSLATSLTSMTAGAAFTINGSSYVRIGDSAAPGSATGDDDLFVEGDLEVDATIYADGGARVASGQNLTLAGITTNNAVLYATTSTGVVAAASTDSTNLCLVSGASAPSWASCGTGTDAFWDQASGALYAKNSTVDLLIGSSASTSAKFAVLNVNSGTPTASVSAGLAGGAYLTATGNLATTAMQNMTLGGSTTGSITIDSGTGIVNLADATASRIVFTDASKNLTYSALSSVISDSVTDETGSGALVFASAPSLSSPTITGSPTAAGATWTDLGSVTTADINGGTIDGTAIGASVRAGGSFTTLDGNGNITLGDNSSDTIALNGQLNTGITFVKETARTIQIADSTTSNAAGADLTIKGAAGASTNAAGGAVNLTGGAGAGTGAGGALALTAGAAGSTGTGGAITFTTGAGGSVSGGSGTLTLDTGTVTSGTVGSVVIKTGGTAGITLNSSQNITLAGTTITASSLATFTTAATLGMTSTTALNLGSNSTITSSATALNLQSDGTPDVNIAGGSGATGCTIANSTGNLTCTGDITGGATGTVGFWTRTGTSLSPATAGDAVTTSGNISTSGSGTITSAGTLTASNGLTLTTGALSLTGTSGSIALTGFGTTAITSTTTTGNINTFADSSLAVAAGATGNLLNLTFTNSSVNTTGEAITTGINIAPTNSSAGTGGTMSTYGIKIADIAGTTGAGIQNNYGIRIGNQGQASSETSYGLYVDSQTGSTTSYAAVFAGGNVGIGVTTPGEELTLASTYALGWDNGSGTVDTVLSRGATNRLDLASGDSLRIVAGQLQMDTADGGTSATGIVFGATPDVNLYRSAANILKTDDTIQAVAFYDGDNTAYFLDPAATGTSLVIAGQADIEGYASIGNGSALSADNTLILNRAFTASSGSSPSILSIPAQTITENGGAGTHALISGVSLTAPTITGGTHTVTDTATLYISGAMSATVTGANYALWVDGGTSRFDDFVSVNNAASPAYSLDIGSTVSSARGVNIAQSGAKTAADYGLYLANTSTSSTGSINKYGAYITSTGTWNGASANNYGLYVESPTGGTANYAAIFAGGNVGIGTAAPGSQLEIEGSGSGDGVHMIIQNTGSDPAGIRLLSGHGNWEVYNSKTVADALEFVDDSAGATRMIIDSSGNVSIGNTVNSVFDQVGAARPLVVNGSDTSTTIGGSLAALAIVNRDTTTSNTAQLNFSAITGASTNQYSSAIISAIFGARTNGQYPAGELAFLTSTALNNAPSEKMRIDNAGNVGILNTDPVRTIDVTGNWGGNVLTNAQNNCTTTQTVSTKALVYYLSNADPASGAPTCTFNITGLPNTEGTFAFIATQAIVNGGTNTTVIVQINGTQVSTVTRGGTGTTTENYVVAFSNTGWRIHGTPSTSDSADIAEWYPVSSASEASGELGLPEAGEIIVAEKGQEVGQNSDSQAPNNKLTALVKSYKAYQGTILGIVSTKPAMSIGKDFDVNTLPIRQLALSGRVITKVSTENGPVMAGDAITSSSVPGVGMKATKPGQIVGRALEPFSCSAIQQSNNQTICTGKVLVFVNPSWHDPDVYLTGTGNLSIVSNSQYPVSSSKSLNTQYSILNTLGQVIDRVGVFAQLAVANLRAGSINVQELVANQLVASKLVSPIAEIDVVRTNLISPLASGNGSIIVKLGEQKEASPTPKFEIQDASGSAIASIDSTGNATFSGQLSSNGLSTSDASISGTLRADRIIANNIEGLDARIASLSASQVSSTEYRVSSPSANTEYSIPDTGYLTLTASESASLAYVGNLSAETATFNQGLIALGPSSLMDTSVAGQLSINSSLILADNSINVLGADLEIQPFRQGGISFLSGLIHIDLEGNLNVSGNAAFAKDVTVRGKLASNIISPLPDQDIVVSLPSSAIHNSEFIIQNSTGSAILSIDNLGDLIASGSGTFNKLKLSLAAPVLALSPTEAVASGSAGIATISAQQTQLTITNPMVTETSLIYITPVGNPNGQTPYLLRQVPNTSFTAGIQLPSGFDTTFNWLIVN